MKHRLLTSAIGGILLPVGAVAAFMQFAPYQKTVDLPRGFSEEAARLIAARSSVSHPVVRVSSTPASLPEGMCEIILEAHDVFSNGVSGYQLLLDSDHNTAFNRFWEPAMYYYGDYSDFEYALPADAEAVKGTDKCLIDGEESAVIPAGVYDWMVILPEPEGLWIPEGDFSAVDDFELLAGKTYRIVVDYHLGDFGGSDYVSAIFESDVAITDIKIPATGLDLGNDVPVTVIVANLGTTPAAGFTLSYGLNNDPVVTEKSAAELQPGEEMAYTFECHADFSRPGKYTVTATVAAEGDMYGGNNTATASCRHLTAMNLPWSCNFSVLGADLEQDWMVVDSNGDGSTWCFSEWIANKEGSMGVVACAGCWIGDRIGDDWLISPPLSMKEGKVSVAYDHRSVQDTNTEKLEVCIGVLPDPSAMSAVATSEVCSTAWIERGMTLDIPADGIYYIAFHGISQNGLNQFIGNVTVSEGEFIGVPDIDITGMTLPASNCDLPREAYIGIDVINRGTAPLTDYTLTATVNGESKSRSFTEPVAVDAVATLLLDTPFDFSAKGEYEVSFSLTAAGVDESVTGSVECFEPFTELPFVTNFTNDKETWFWTALDPAAWHYEAAFSDFSATAHGMDKGLIGRGMTLSHPVRVKMSYVASGWDGTALGIYFGKAGAEISTYSRVFSDPQVTSTPVEVEFEVPVAEAGNYSIIIADEGATESRSFLRLNEVQLAEVLPYDLCIEAVNATVSSYMPVSQVKGTGKSRVMISNRGLEVMESVKVNASIDGKSAGESAPLPSIAPGESATIYVEVAFPEKQIGESFNLEFEVSASMPDDYDADNCYALPRVNITKDERATEDIEELVYGTGVFGSTVSVGNLYSFHTTVDLTSVSVGLCFCEDGSSIAQSSLQLAIWQVDDDNVLQRCLYTEQFVRGSGGLEVIDFQDMRLEPGNYLFEVTQLSVENMGLAYDPMQAGGCWQRVDNTLTYVDGYSLCIRANFWSDAVVSASDACVRAITTPDLEEALFGEEETVRAVVRNAGYEGCTTAVTLSLDGEIKGEQTLSLLPYEEVEVTFSNVDLSVPGKHTLTCSTVMPGDTNDENDAKTLILTSADELSPYFMNFEGCPDFAADGDRLNPKWSTFDRNGVGTTYFWRYEYPRRGEACGFIAFNTHATKPSGDEMPTPGFYSYDGDRFGVAYCFDQFGADAGAFTESDVWIMSPQLELGENSQFVFHVKTFALEHMQATLEPYRVLISDTDNDPDHFIVLGDDVRRAAVDEWEEVTVDLSAYDNRKVYVALQYIGRPVENTCLMIDDLNVVTSPTGAELITKEKSATLRYDSAGKSLETGSDSAVEVYTADGRRVMKGNGPVVDVSRLASGIYVARSGEAVVKFVR